MIQESYVSYEVAKLLKEKGFNEPTRFVWYERLPASIGCDESKIGKNYMELFYYNSTTQFEQSFINNRKIPDYIQGEVYSAPTQQMAMRWLREEKRIFIDIMSYTTSNQIQFRWVGYDNGRFFSQEEGKTICFNSYEDACEEAIKYCLENLI